jgi:hypothetical protein
MSSAYRKPDTPSERCAALNGGMSYNKAARTTTVGAALAMAALILAGCSNAPAGTGNTTGQNALKFSQCMRANGVSAFPDPDASGSLTIDGVVNGSSIDTNSTAWKQAISACKALEPAGFTGGTGAMTPQRKEARLKFAQCIRDNGVSDFPDPSDTAPLVDTNLIPSAGTANGMSILNAAMHKCGSFVAAAK